MSESMKSLIEQHLHRVEDLKEALARYPDLCYGRLVDGGEHVPVSELALADCDSAAFVAEPGTPRAGVLVPYLLINDRTPVYGRRWSTHSVDGILYKLAAPEMARMLLGLEWGLEKPDYEGVATSLCFECEREEYEGHADGCAFVALLRKAGVR